MKSLKKIICCVFWLSALGLPPAHADTVQWINHLDLLSGNPRELTITTNSTSSGVGGGLAGVVAKSSSIGESFSDGGNKVVHMALNLPPQPNGITIRGVRVCFESTSTATYLSQIRIAEVQNPPSSATVKLDDGTNWTLAGPNCVTSKVAANIPVGNGPLLLSLRLFFGSVSDAIVIRGLGIVLG